MHRILVIDDNRAIHHDFRKIPCPTSSAVADLSAAEAALFGDDLPAETKPEYEMDSAYQGQEALALASKTVMSSRPYSLAFVDGAATMRALQKREPNIKVMATSGIDPDAKFEELKSLGMKALIAKPYTADTILTTLRDVLAAEPPRPV
jgi:CheY-like chemotaxis protein